MLSGTVAATTLSEAQMPKHQHAPMNQSSFIVEGVGASANISTSGGSYIRGEWTDDRGGSTSHTHTISVSTNKENSLPSFYVLSFIMRLS